MESAENRDNNSWWREDHTDVVDMDVIDGEGGGLVFSGRYCSLTYYIFSLFLVVLFVSLKKSDLLTMSKVAVRCQAAATQ